MDFNSFIPYIILITFLGILTILFWYCFRKKMTKTNMKVNPQVNTNIALKVKVEEQKITPSIKDVKATLLNKLKKDSNITDATPVGQPVSNKPANSHPKQIDVSDDICLIKSSTEFELDPLDPSMETLETVKHKKTEPIITAFRNKLKGTEDRKQAANNFMTGLVLMKDKLKLTTIIDEDEDAEENPIMKHYQKTAKKSHEKPKSGHKSGPKSGPKSIKIASNMSTIDSAVDYQMQMAEGAEAVEKKKAEMSMVVNKEQKSGILKEDQDYRLKEAEEMDEHLKYMIAAINKPFPKSGTKPLPKKKGTATITEIDGKKTFIKELKGSSVIPVTRKFGKTALKVIRSDENLKAKSKAKPSIGKLSKDASKTSNIALDNQLKKLESTKESVKQFQTQIAKVSSSTDDLDKDYAMLDMVSFKDFRIPSHLMYCIGENDNIESTKKISDEAKMLKPGSLPKIGCKTASLKDETRSKKANGESSKKMVEEVIVPTKQGSAANINIKGSSRELLDPVKDADTDKDKAVPSKQGSTDSIGRRASSNMIGDILGAKSIDSGSGSNSITEMNEKTIENVDAMIDGLKDMKD